MNNTEAETQAQSCPPAVSASGEERVKNFLYMLAADARAVVIKFDAHRLIAAALDVAASYAKQSSYPRLRLAKRDARC